MADKFRKTIPIRITFAAGEQPTSTKINAIADQGRAGNNLLEQAIGDPWNESGDAILNSSPLQIPNLARSIGQNSLYNPALVPTATEFNYTENIGVTFENKNTGYLRFPPKFGSVDETVTGDHFVITTGGSQFTTPVDFEWEVDALGKYWIEKDTGKFRIFGDLVVSTKIAYIVDPVGNWIPGQETLPGVIPDPGQVTFTSCRISQSGAKFLIHLPPRRPVVLSTKETPDNYPPSSEFSDNEQSTPGITVKKYWQDSITALTGIGDEHYRYALPKEIQDATLIPGQQIPAGFLYLWNNNTNTIVSDAIFRWPDLAFQGFALEVESATFDFSVASILSTAELEAEYSKTSLSIITVGSPISRSIWTLASSFLQHRHDNEGTMEPSVQHKDLRDLNPPSAAAILTGEDYSGHNTRYPTALPAWPTSRWAYDEHTSLLSRAGAQTDPARIRDRFNNAMLGDMIFANNLPSNYLDGTVPNNSFKLYFGDTDGNYIHGTPLGIQSIAATGSGNEGLRGQGDGTGPGIVGSGGSTDAPGGSFFGGGLNGAGAAGTAVGAGTGLLGIGGPTNGIGMVGQGKGTGAGIFGYTDDAITTQTDTYIGVEGHGSVTNNGAGIYGLGGGSGVGLFGKGGTINGRGVVGQGLGTGAGVFGYSDDASTTQLVSNVGVEGHGSITNNGIGIYGRGGGLGTGIYGRGGITNGKGVFGQGIGAGAGVFGHTGDASSSQLSNYVGVEGHGSITNNGIGVFGQGGGSGTGLHGAGGTTNGKGVVGQGIGLGAGVFGYSDDASTTTVSGYMGVQGHGSVTNNGAGIYGMGGGTGVGVLGISSNAAVFQVSNYAGVEGHGSITNNGIGIYGRAGGSGTGVYGEGGVNNGRGILGQGQGTGVGVFGYSGNAISVQISDYAGVEGHGSLGNNGVGVYGFGGGSGTGVHGLSNGTGGTGVFGQGGFNGRAIHGSGIGAGVGVYGESQNGPGIEAVSNATRGSLNLVPISVEPIAPQKGELYVNSITNNLRFYNGSMWITIA